MPAFFIDREECESDILRPGLSWHDEPTPIETLAFIGREFGDPKMTATMATVLGIEMPMEGVL